jgi:DNA-binding MarR family transcriptional regulator
VPDRVERRGNDFEKMKGAAKPPGGHLGKSDYERLAAFRYTLRRFLSFSEAAAHEIGLASQQYQALLVVKGFPGRDAITVNELAQQLLIKHNSAVGLVNRLESEGLVRRQSSIGDRRKVDVVLTSKGTLAFERLAATHHAELARIEPELREFLEYVSKPSPTAPGGRARTRTTVRTGKATRPFRRGA